jgi:hypothetical protein
MTKETEHERGVVSISVQLGNIQTRIVRYGEHQEYFGFLRVVTEQSGKKIPMRLDGSSIQ